MFVNSLFWFDNDFVIESKYHRKIVVLFLKARILSLQDVIFRSMFFLIFISRIVEFCVIVIIAEWFRFKFFNRLILSMTRIINIHSFRNIDHETTLV